MMHTQRAVSEMDAHAVDPKSEQGMKVAPAFTTQSVFFMFGPWIVYGLLAATGHKGAAYVGGLCAELLQTVPQWRARRLKILDGATLLFFGAGSVVTLVLHSTLFLKDSSVLVWGTFAVVAWGSLLAGSPFTAQYARDAVPRSYWEQPSFRRANSVITAMWGMVFTVNATLTAAAILASAGASGRAWVWLQLMPYAATVFGIMFTNRYSQWVSGRQPVAP